MYMHSAFQMAAERGEDPEIQKKCPQMELATYGNASRKRPLLAMFSCLPRPLTTCREASHKFWFCAVASEQID